jgi:hypothetical protein
MYLPCPIISLSLLAFYLVFVGCVNFGVLVLCFVFVLLGGVEQCLLLRGFVVLFVVLCCAVLCVLCCIGV